MDDQHPVSEDEAKRLLDTVEGLIKLEGDPNFTLLLRYFQGVSQNALEEMLDVAPTDATKIAELQVKAKVPAFIEACLHDMIHQGIDIEIQEEAEQEIIEDALAETENGEETDATREGE